MIAGVKRFLDGVTKWASQWESILAVALVGSQARGTASACSDVDLIIPRARACRVHSCDGVE